MESARDIGTQLCLSPALISSDSAASVIKVPSHSNGLGIIGGRTVSGIGDISLQFGMADTIPTPSQTPTPTTVPSMALHDTLEGAVISAIDVGKTVLNTGIIPSLPTVVVPSPELLNSIQVPQPNSQIESIEDIVLPEASALSQTSGFSYGKSLVPPSKIADIEEGNT